MWGSLLAAFLLAGPLRAGDPPHLRAAELPPRSWTGVFAPRARVRLYWEGGGTYAVERYTRRGWETLEPAARSGWTSPPLPRGTALRLRSAGGEAGRALLVAPLRGPVELAGLAGPGALGGARVVDIATAPGGDPWCATLGGGAAVLEDGRFRVLGRADGLPSELVVAVAADGSGAWLGTAGGLARVERRDGDWRVVRLLGAEDGLPDDYVQALALDGERLWVGTYHGLAALDPGREPEVLLQPWSVFSLLRGPDRRMWVGYEGLRGLPEGEPIEGVPPELDVYDFEVLPGRGTVLATYQEGAVLLWEGERVPLWPGSEEDGAYALAAVGPELLAAGAGAGLVSLAPGGRLLKHWSRADGLPSEAVDEVVPDGRPAPGEGGPTGAWLGTERGLAHLELAGDRVRPLPLSPLAAGLPVRTVLRRPGGWLFAGDGFAFASGPLRGGRLRELPAGELVEVLRARGRSWWVFADRVLERRPWGRDRLHRLPFRVRAAAVAAGLPWLGGEGGALRFDPRIGRFEPVQGLGAISVLRGAGQELWAIAGGVVTRVDASLELRRYLRTHRPLDLSPDGALVWVGTPSGLDVLQRDTGEVLGLLRSADEPVRVPSLAADGLGGCWVGTEQGYVLHLDVGGGGARLYPLDPAEPPEIRRILAFPGGRAWVLTDRGVYALERARAPGP